MPGWPNDNSILRALTTVQLSSILRSDDRRSRPAVGRGEFTKSGGREIARRNSGEIKYFTTEIARAVESSQLEGKAMVLIGIRSV